MLVWTEGTMAGWLKDATRSQALASLGDSPEQRLMAAVLMQAVDDLRLVRGHRGRSHLSEVERWFQDHDLRWLFSFESVCVALAVDADSIRAALGSACANQWSTRERSSRGHAANV
jgi:hypothetical protein